MGLDGLVDASGEASKALTTHHALACMMYGHKNSLEFASAIDNEMKGSPKYELTNPAISVFPEPDGP